MSTDDYEEVLRQVQLLSFDDQLRLLQELASIIRRRLASHPKHSVLEFKGMGKELWESIDVEKYIDAERNSWER
jgi:hypothetical protein